jgi:outer membrane protein OmpA-like peptidoglycan-associated protein
MPRRAKSHHHEEELNIFQAFTDLMSNAFMIVVFLLLISLLQSAWTAKKLESASPIIIDEKSGNFRFPSGSAKLTPELRKYIVETIIPRIKTETAKGNIDFIQIIGHTDSQSVNNTSNLDTKITAAATGGTKIDTLIAGSNTDLGLMRAMAVVEFLQVKVLRKVKFRAYSAGQLYLPSGEVAKATQGADDARRRIEIRFIPHGQSK